MTVINDLTDDNYVFVKHIFWDTDGEDVPDLPMNALIPKSRLAHDLGRGFDEDAIVDWLSDEYGFCIKSLDIEPFTD